MALRGERSKSEKKLAGEAKQGSYGAPRALVERLLPESLEDLLSMLTNENDELADACESLSAPICFRDPKVDPEAQRVYYRNRHGKEVSVAFKTLENYISLLNKK